MEKPCASCGALIQGRRAVPKFCSEECKPRCSVDGCDGVARKRGWCASHYAQTRRTGRPPEPFIWKWAERSPCLVCRSATEGSGFRRFCSDACRVLYQSNDGARPTTTPCVACGDSIDLLERGNRGQRRKVTVKFCRPCKQDYAKYKMSARELARRYGTGCGICGEPVDLNLRRSDSIRCASVDHIIPRSLGGGHEPENLQLAHLDCNMRKSDRVAAPDPKTTQTRGQRQLALVAEGGD